MVSYNDSSDCNKSKDRHKNIFFFRYPMWVCGFSFLKINSVTLPSDRGVGGVKIKRITPLYCTPSPSIEIMGTLRNKWWN